jgi:hypothetical protein
MYDQGQDICKQLRNWRCGSLLYMLYKFGHATFGGLAKIYNIFMNGASIQHCGEAFDGYLISIPPPQPCR